jgi:predicted tellurium resistance membrane protein TerC
VLIWVAYKLLRLDVENGNGDKQAKEAKNFRQAVLLILTADFMMSLDNVIAVAGAAHGHIILLVAGLLLSMPLLMTSGGFISLLIDRFKWLIFLGAFAITFTATRMIFEDRFVEARFHQPVWVALMVAAIAGVVLPGLFIWLNTQRKRMRAEVTCSDSNGEE